MGSETLTNGSRTLTGGVEGYGVSLAQLLHSQPDPRYASPPQHERHSSSCTLVTTMTCIVDHTRQHASPTWPRRQLQVSLAHMHLTGGLVGEDIDRPPVNIDSGRTCRRQRRGRLERGRVPWFSVLGVKCHFFNKPQATSHKPQAISHEP